MGRRKGVNNSDKYVTLSTRVTRELAAAAHNKCLGEDGGLSTWLRNHIRQACGIPLNYAAGYEEGFNAGWTEANQKFKDGMKRASAE